MTPREVEIRLLGRFRVLVGGHEVPASAFGGRKVRTLLAVLAVNRDRYVSHDALAEALWPVAAPADPAANLGVLVNRARRAVADAGLIGTGPRGYALAARCGLDTDRFAAEVAQARRAAAEGADRGALACWGTALAGWSGPPLAEEADAGWAREFRAHLLGLRQEALEEAAGLAAELGESTLAVGYATEAVAAAPLREVAALRLSRAHEVAGDPAAALDDLRQLRDRLRDELGVDPSPEVTDRYDRLLHRADPAPPAGTGPGELPLLGRRAQLAALLGAVRGPAPPVVELAAPAGAGKSRLLAELTAALGRPVLAARAYLPERAEPWSLVRGLLRAALAIDPASAAALPRSAVPALLDVLPDLVDLVPEPAAAVARPGHPAGAGAGGRGPDAGRRGPRGGGGGPRRPAVGRPGQPARARRPAGTGAGAAGGARVPARGGAGRRSGPGRPWPAADRHRSTRAVDLPPLGAVDLAPVLDPPRSPGPCSPAPTACRSRSPRSSAS